MLALFVIGNTYVAAVIATAGAIWIVGAAHGLRAALLAHAIHYTEIPPPPPPRLPEPRKWASDNSHALMLLWPHAN